MEPTADKEHEEIIALREFRVQEAIVKVNIFFFDFLKTGAYTCLSFIILICAVDSFICGLLKYTYENIQSMALFLKFELK